MGHVTQVQDASVHMEKSKRCFIHAGPGNRTVSPTVVTQIHGLPHLRLQSEGVLSGMTIANKVRPPPGRRTKAVFYESVGGLPWNMEFSTGSSGFSPKPKKIEARIIYNGIPYTTFILHGLQRILATERRHSWSASQLMDWGGSDGRHSR